MREEFTLTLRRRRIIRVEIESANAHPQLKFNLQAVADLGLDRHVIQRTFDDLAPTVEDISWG